MATDETSLRTFSPELFSFEQHLRLPGFIAPLQTARISGDERTASSIFFWTVPGSS